MTDFNEPLRIKHCNTSKKHNPHKWSGQADLSIHDYECEGQELFPRISMSEADQREAYHEKVVAAEKAARAEKQAYLERQWNDEIPSDSDLAYILNIVMPEVHKRMVVSGKHYGYETHHELGLRGQYADMYRKWCVLKRFMWDGEVPTRESLREILLDMVGHSLLTVALLDRGSLEFDHEL
jgi:hypothetical protein